MMDVKFLRSTHDENGNYKFRGDDSLEKESADFIIHMLNPMVWMSLSEIVVKVREYEKTFAYENDSGQPDRMSIYRILEGLACLTEKGMVLSLEMTANALDVVDI
jgi:hypothetical protein